MATGTIKQAHYESGTPTLVSGSGASFVSGDWAGASWNKYGQIVIVSFAGIKFSSSFSDGKDVLNVPFRATSHTLQSCAKDIAFIVEISENDNHIKFSNVGTANKNLFGQLIYITSD